MYLTSCVNSLVTNKGNDFTETEMKVFSATPSGGKHFLQP